MKITVILVAAVSALVFPPGCGTGPSNDRPEQGERQPVRNHAASRETALTQAELEVLGNYQASPEMVERAARICLARRLSKEEVVRFMGKTTRTETEDRMIRFFWMPSQILTFRFDDSFVIVEADLGDKKITADDLE